MTKTLRWIDWAGRWELSGYNGIDYYLARGWEGYLQSRAAPPWSRQGCIYTKSSFTAALESTFADESARAEFDRLTAWSRSYERPTDFDPSVGGGRIPFPFQVGAAKALSQYRRLILADEMGWGKTLSAIMGANAIGEELQTILVLMPASLRINWSREIASYQTLGLPIYMWEDYKKLCSNSEEKIKGWVLCTYDRTLKSVDGLFAVKWDLMICDEAHRLKNANAKRSAIALGDNKMMGLADMIPNLFLLTGTPIKNETQDLFQLVRAVNPVQWRWWEFAQDHLGWISNPPKKPRGARDRNLQELETRWRLGSMMRRTESPDLKLPAVIRRTILVGAQKKADSVDWTPELAEIDAAARQQASNDVQDVLGGEDPSKLNPGRLRVSFDRTYRLATKRRLSGQAKVEPTVDRACSLIEQGEKVVLFAYHQDVVAGLIDGVRAAGHKVVSVEGGMTPTKRQQAVDDFQESDAMCCVCQIIAAGEGITLTSARYLIVVEMDWTVAANNQAECRIKRIGQNAPSVIFEYIINNDGIDGRIIRACRRKAALIACAIDGTTLRVQVDDSRRQETLLALSKIDGAYEEELFNQLSRIPVWTKGLDALAWSAITADEELQ